MRQIIAGVTISCDDGRTVEYRFDTQRNRARFESLLRYDLDDDESIADILQRYDAYLASQS